MSQRGHRGPGRTQRKSGRYTPPTNRGRVDDHGRLSDAELDDLVQRVGEATEHSCHLDPALQAEVDAAAAELIEPIVLSTGESLGTRISLAVPTGFVAWLDSEGLETDFLAAVADARSKNRHGDIMTAFARRNGAPTTVLEMINAFGSD